MKIVVALGGNALAPPDAAFDFAVQQQRVAIAARLVAELAVDHHVVVTHGNGPQVGYLAARQELPLDVLDAESAGLIGYSLEQAISDLLPERDIVTLLTRTLVDRRDPAFAAPTKPIGAFYPKSDAARLANERGWSMHEFVHGWRRVVASPQPLGIIETRPIELLSNAGIVVICDGGGGIPVCIESGRLHGVEAVVDKDASSAVLAVALHAAVLLILTDVDAVYDGFGTAHARSIRTASPAALRALRFEPGSMAPKVSAACHFAEASQGYAAIGALHDGAAVLRGEAGTRVDAARTGMDFGP